jgi:2-C-methyl-D-erythritol 2,4-cyclodiphosphate synthase
MYTLWLKNNMNNIANLRIGQGYDIHALVEGRPLILAGIHIPYHKGLLGHSDADVLVHAIIDALLGAANLGDIGRLFPDNAAEYKDINSMLLLEKTISLLTNNHYSIINVDCTIIAQQPKLSSYIQDMQDNLNAANINYISIKAKTNEGFGYIGSGEAIAVHTCCLIYLNNFC